MVKTFRKCKFLLIAAFALLILLTLSSCSKGSRGSEDSIQEDKGPGNHYSFLVCGDPDGRVDLLERIISQRGESEFLVIVGDLTTGSGIQEMKRMKDFLDSKAMPYHVIPGDNDMPGGNLSNFQSVFGPDYYATDVQDSHLVFLDDAVPGIGCPGDELTWLKGDLSGAGGKVIIAFAHVPAGAPVTLSDADAMSREADSAREMLALLRDAGTAVLYSGHIHAYLPFSDGPPRIIVSGGAGASLHLSEPAGGYYHFLRVTVNDDRITEEVIRL